MKAVKQSRARSDRTIWPVRIYDIAKKLGLDNKEVLSKAKELGMVAAKVASSSLDKITAEYLSDKLKEAHPELTAPPPPLQPRRPRQPPPAPPPEPPPEPVPETPTVVVVAAPPPEIVAAPVVEKVLVEAEPPAEPPLPPTPVIATEDGSCGQRTAASAPPAEVVAPPCHLRHPRPLCRRFQEWGTKWLH